MKQVLISLEEYKRLVGRDTELRQLESTGIDNWTNLPLTSAILYGKDGRKEIEDAQEECEKRVVCSEDHLAMAWANLDGCDVCGKTWLY